MTEEEILHNECELGKFFAKERRKSIAFLRRNYSLSENNAEDIYQEACLAMYNNIQNGKLVHLTSKLSTYFKQICVFQALKKKRNEKYTEEYDPQKVTELMEFDSSFTIRQQQAMEDLIKSLPVPCNTILWLYYYDNLSMAEIARTINFGNANSVKSKKSQCMTKLKTKYANIIKSFMYE